jgi:exodeoxyribonuclease VII small subunit
MQPAHRAQEPESAAEEPSFEAALARLGEIVESLEKGDLPLERSLALFEEGVRLSRLGAERLENAEARVEQLLGSGKIQALDPKSAGTKTKEPR